MRHISMTPPKINTQFWSEDEGFVSKHYETKNLAAAPFSRTANDSGHNSHC